MDKRTFILNYAAASAARDKFEDPMNILEEAEDLWMAIEGVYPQHPQASAIDVETLEKQTLRKASKPVKGLRADGQPGEAD